MIFLDRKYDGDCFIGGFGEDTFVEKRYLWNSFRGYQNRRASLPVPHGFYKPINDKPGAANSDDQLITLSDLA